MFPKKCNMHKKKDCKIFCGLLYNHGVAVKRQDVVEIVAGRIAYFAGQPQHFNIAAHIRGKCAANEYTNE